MQYTRGAIGKVYVMKFDDGDVLLDELSGFIVKERIRAAVMFFIGALRSGTLVTGPKKPVRPPVPNKLIFKLTYNKHFRHSPFRSYILHIFSALLIS